MLRTRNLCCSAHLLEDGVDIRVIQVLLGHAKLDNTALYTRMATRVVRTVTSPLDKIMVQIGTHTSLGDHAGLSEQRAFTRHLAPLRKKNWVVYAKPPFAGTEAVLAYLSRSRPGSCSRCRQQRRSPSRSNHRTYGHRVHAAAAA